MPRSRESDPQKIATLEQYSQADLAHVLQEYDTFLSGFTAGDHGRVDLGADEQRTIVRDQLQAAARRRDLALRFRPGRGPLIFVVERVPQVVPAVVPAEPGERLPPAPLAPPVLPPASPTPPPSAVAAAEPNRPPSRPPSRPARERPERPERPAQRPRAARPASSGRYDDVLPRWMREGQQAGPRRNPRPKRRRP